MPETNSTGSHPCCEDVYRAFEDFFILNEVNIPFLVADFSPGSSRLLWANKTCLDAFGALSLDEFQAVDLNAEDEDDDSIGAIFQDIYTTTQIEHKSVSRTQSLDLRALKCDAKLHCRPCQVLLPDEDDVRTVTFVAIHSEDAAETPAEQPESSEIERLKERIKDLERQTCERTNTGGDVDSMIRHRNDSISSITRGAMLCQDSLKSIASQAPVKVHSDLFGTHEILSVDDNLVNHMVVENALEPKGFVVTVCMSGIEALELIKSREYLPDLILLDCMMPEMNGYETCEQLRQAFPYIAIPVIMVSAKDHEADVVMGLKSGCNDYLKKPYGTNELIARINVHLKLRQLWNSEVQRHISKRYRADVQIPDTVVSRFSAGADTMLDKHTDATVLVLDLVDILAYVDHLPASEFTEILNKIYSMLDRIVKTYGATRIIDDTYMVVLGDGTAVDGGRKLDKCDQAAKMVKMAAEMLDGVKGVAVALPNGPTPVRVQIGIAAGQAYSALVGIKMTYYTYFGNAVREACELLVRGYPMCVHVSTDVQARLGNSDAMRLLLACGEYSRTDETTGGTVRRKTYVAKLGAYQEFLGKDEAERQFPAAIPSGEIPTKPSLEPEPEVYLSQKTARHYRAFMRALSTETGSGYSSKAGMERPQPQVLSECATCAQLQDRLEAMDEIEDVVEARVLQLCLPESLIAQALMEREAGSVLARKHERMSILVSNVVAYTALSVSLSAEEMVLLTNKMLQRFEELSEDHGCLNIETCGGMFAVAAGHDGDAANHAEKLVRLGLDMIDAMRSIEFPRAHHKHLQCRIGIHTGDAKSGVIWASLPRYIFFGDTMITAKGLEAMGYAMCIHVSDETRKELQGAFDVEALGKNTLKGKGAMDTFLVKDPRCAWESAIIKAHHQQLVSDSSAAQQILAGQSLHSAAASFNVPFKPKDNSDASHTAASSPERVVKELSSTELAAINEKRKHFERTPSEERRSSLEQEWGRLGLKFSRAHTPDIDMIDGSPPDPPAPSRDEGLPAGSPVGASIVSSVHRLPPSLTADGRAVHRRVPDDKFKQEVEQSMRKLNVERKSGNARCDDCVLNLERAEDALWALDLLRAEHENLARQCAQLSSMLQTGGSSRRMAEYGPDGVLSEEQQVVEEVVDEFLFKQFIRQAHVHHEEIEKREALHQQERENRDAFTVSIIRDFANLAAIPVPDIDGAPVDEAFHEAAMRAAEATQGVPGADLTAEAIAAQQRYETNGAAPHERMEAIDERDGRAS